MISRRAVLGGLGTAAAWPLAGRAQPALRRVPRIGFISANSAAGASPFLGAIRSGFVAYGYSEPASLATEALYADDAPDRVPGLVAQVQRLNVEVIVTHAAATSLVVKSPRTVPVVYEFSADPVTTGIATDLAHPLFNSTGVTLMRAELNGKRLEILHEIRPQLQRVGVIANPLHAGEHLERAELSAKATQLGIELTFFSTPNEAGLEEALSALSRDPPQALVAFSEAFVVQKRQRIIELATSLGIPVVSGWDIMAKSGALFTYGPRLKDAYSRTAYFVDRLLRGAKAAELPIEQPSVLELIVNLKAAKTVGIEIPPTLLARADEVIE